MGIITILLPFLLIHILCLEVGNFIGHVNSLSKAATATTSPPLCYVQQLETAARNNLSTMIILEEAGPFVSTEPSTFDNGTCKYSQQTTLYRWLYLLTFNGTANPHARYHTTCADDCSWPPSVRPWRLRNASTAPVRGVCGLKWLSKTLDFLRPYVEKGTLQGFSEFSRSRLGLSVTIADSDAPVAVNSARRRDVHGWLATRVAVGCGGADPQQAGRAATLRL